MKKTRAPIVYEGGHGFAIFQTIEKNGTLYLVLDRTDQITGMPRLFHPVQTLLTSAAPGAQHDLEYLGDAIAIDDFDKLDELRRGFFYCQ